MKKVSDDFICSRAGGEGRYKGFYSVAVGLDGRRFAVKVVNYGVRRNDNKVIPKVRNVRYLGATGWSGGCNYVYGLDKPYYLDINRVTLEGVFKSEKGAINEIRKSL